MKTTIIFLFAIFTIQGNLHSQEVGEYRTSGASSFWSENTAWELFDGVSWVTPVTYPQGIIPKVTINHHISLWNTQSSTNMNVSLNAMVVNNSTLTIGIDNGPTQNFTGRLTINKGTGKNFINNGNLRVFGELELNATPQVPNLDSTFLNFGMVEFIALQNADITSGCLKGQGGFINNDSVRFYNGAGTDFARDICFDSYGEGLDIRNYGVMSISSIREEIRVIGPLPVTIYSDNELNITAFQSPNSFNIVNDGLLNLFRALPANTEFSFHGKITGTGLARINSNLPTFRLMSYNNDTLHHDFSIPLSSSRLLFGTGNVWIGDDCDFDGDGYLGASNATLNIKSSEMDIGIQNFSSTINFLSSDTTRLRKYNQQGGILSSIGVITVSDSLLLGTVIGAATINPGADIIALQSCQAVIRTFTMLTEAKLILNGKTEFPQFTSIFIQFANSVVVNNDSIKCDKGMLLNGGGKFINNGYYEVSSPVRAEFIPFFENNGVVNISDGQLWVKTGRNTGTMIVNDSLYINGTGVNPFVSDSGSAISGNGVIRTFQALINIFGEWSFEGFANYDAVTINFSPADSDSVVFYKTQISSAGFGYLGIGGTARKIFTDSVLINHGGFNSGGDVIFTNTAALRMVINNSNFYGPLNIYIYCNTIDSINNTIENIGAVNIYNFGTYEIKSNRNSTGSTSSKFINNGTLIKNRSGIGGYMNTFFENDGIVNVIEGTLQIRNGINNSIFNIDDSLSINNTTGQFVIDTTSVVNGSGTFVTSITNVDVYGEWNFNGMLAMSSTDINFSLANDDTVFIKKTHINNSGFGRTGIKGSSVKVFTDTVTHQSGGFTGGADVIFSTSAFYKILPNFGLTNVGPQNITINCNTLDSNNVNSASIYGGNVNVINNGHFKKLALGFIGYSNSTPASTFQNNGTFELSANQFQVTFDAGIIFVNSGNIKLNSGTLLFSGTNYTGNGKIETAANSIFKIGNLIYGNQHLINNGTLDVSTFSFSNNTDTISGTGKINGLFTISGGQNVRINGSQQFHNLTVNSGGVLDVVNSAMFVSGTLNNNGTIKTKTGDSPISSRSDIDDYLDAGKTNIRENSLRTSNDSTEIGYNGTSEQTIAANIEYLILTLDNPAGTVINAPILVESGLNLINGNLNNGNNLTIAPNANVNIIQGSLQSPPVYQSPPDVIYLSDLVLTTGNELPDSVQSLSVMGLGEVTLGKNIFVIGNLNVIRADLNLADKIINFSSTSSLTETDTAFVKASDGYIETTREIDSPSNLNVAGLGVIISSASNLGMTTVRRGHSISFEGMNESIKRYYDILPGNNTGLNASMIFNYRDDELNGIPKINLALFRSPDNGMSWTQENSVNDTSANTLSLSGIESFSKWTAGDIDSPLPVSFNSFTAIVDNRNVLLKWETLWEVNNMRFDVQRRIVVLPAPLGSGVEGQIASWSTVGNVTGSGTVNEPRTYSFTDQNLNTGKYEYRIIQIDFDGNSTADHTLSSQVEVGIPNEFALSQNYPNPFNPSTKIDFQIPVEGMTKLVIYDISGREVATLVNEVLTSGYYTYIFNGANFASGVYFYRLVTNNNVITKRMVLVK